MPLSEIRTKNIYKSYIQGEKKIDVLRGVSLHITQGKLCVITGVSGTGKSTLLHLLAGLDTPDRGTIYVDGVDRSQWHAEQLRLWLAQSVGLVFQQPYLIRELTLLENVMTKHLLMGAPSAASETQAQQLLEQVQVPHDPYRTFPGTPSGGQQQRVALARALFGKPTFIIADEPTGNLDIKTGKSIVDLLCDYQKRWNVGLIIASHDPYVAECADIVYTLAEGLISQLKG